MDFKYLDKPLVKLIVIAKKTPHAQSEKLTVFYGFGQTPFGEALIGSTSLGICYLSFIDTNKLEIYREFLQYWEDAELICDNTNAQIYLKNIFFNSQSYDVVARGTKFQIDVWKALLYLPIGAHPSYQDIAIFLKKPKAVRAVANAIGKNRIAYLISCHRVIAKNGSKSGYRWGIRRKQMLLAYEFDAVSNERFNS